MGLYFLKGTREYRNMASSNDCKAGYWGCKTKTENIEGKINECNLGMV